MTDVTLGPAPARPLSRAQTLFAAVLLAVCAVALGMWLTPPAPRLSAPTLRASLGAPLRPDVVPPFVLKTSNAAERERAVRCLTDAVYYEAAFEPPQGQRAIAQVVVNRVRDQFFPKSICGVVYQGWDAARGCQFSFACDGSLQRRRADPERWTRLRRIAEQALAGYVDLDVGTATHYHATYVRPSWLGSVSRVTRVGEHVFYSWRRKAGRVAALRFAYAGGEFLTPDAALQGLRAAG